MSGLLASLALIGGFLALLVVLGALAGAAMYGLYRRGGGGR
jgi:hypothetical protein